MMISEITGITLGQTTPVFKKNPNPVLEVCCVCVCLRLSMFVCMCAHVFRLLISFCLLPSPVSFFLLAVLWPQSGPNLQGQEGVQSVDNCSEG